MLGAIAGDIIGSVYEHHRIKTTEFPLFSKSSTFTDDTVLTIAVADTILHKIDYADSLKSWGRKYPRAGYGLNFRRWLFSDDSQPYNSFGNGSAMRVSPVGFAFEEIEEVADEAKRSAEATHNHPEGIKGAQATAVAIWLARTGNDKGLIKEFIEDEYDYDLSRTLDEIRPVYDFDETCQGTVPEAIIAFLESENFEDAIRKAISLGGDSDTLACITGGIAEAYYKEFPGEIREKVKETLDEDLLEVVEEFKGKYNLK